MEAFLILLLFILIPIIGLVLLMDDTDNEI